MINTKLKIGLISLIIIIVLINIYDVSQYAYLETFFVILQIISIFSTLILLGILPSCLIYTLYRKIFRKILAKRKLKPLYRLYGLSEYMDMVLFEFVMPIGFGSIMLAIDIYFDFRILDQFIFSYWNMISMPIYIIYFCYYERKLFSIIFKKSSK